VRTALSAGHASASASASAAAASDSDAASAALAAAVGAGAGAGAEGGIRRALSGEMETGAAATRTRALLAARQ
jgi:hypothetical protein